MKLCRRPFENIHLDPNGGCRLCSWTDGRIGNLLEEELTDIWNGEKAEIIRQAIKNGDYRYCRATSCPYLENDSLPDLEEEEIRKITEKTEIPKVFSVACDYTCNHSCPSCRECVFVPDKEYKDNLETIIHKIMPMLNKAERILTDGNGDCFSSPQLMNMLENLHPQNPDCTILFETNGALFDEKHWERIKHLGSYKLEITVTPNSFEPTTFKYLNGGHDSYDAVIHNLGFIRDLRKDGIINNFNISIVVQDRNFWELPAFAKRCIEEFEADKVTVKPLYRWFGLSQDDYWFKDVLNPLHPYHKEYLKMLQDPILQNPKVYFWGANNLHKSRLHPAYIYKDHLAMAAKMLEINEAPQMLEAYLKKRNISSLYIYGDMDLGTVLYQVLVKSKVKVKGFVARDICKQKRCGISVIGLCDYTGNEEDTFVVLNYDFMETIERDLRFNGFTGQLISMKEIMEDVFSK